MTDAKARERSDVDGLRYGELPMLDAIQKQGCDLSAPRHVLFYLYFPDEKGAVGRGREGPRRNEVR